MSSQDASRLLDAIDYDGMMTFYSLWHKEVASGAAKTDKILYDLTSISYYGSSIDAVEHGYNRDHESLPQVNYALLCMRSTAMPLFAWPMNGSVSDVATLETTLQFFRKLRFEPNGLVMDREFCSLDNFTGMFKNGYTFLQALKANAKWICEVIDASESARFNPNSKSEIWALACYEQMWQMINSGQKVFLAAMECAILYRNHMSWERAACHAKVLHQGLPSAAVCPRRLAKPQRRLGFCLRRRGRRRKRAMV
jgi:hypothetical protein